MDVKSPIFHWNAIRDSMVNTSPAILTMSMATIPWFYTFFGEDPTEARRKHWDYSEEVGRSLYGLIFASLVSGKVYLEDILKKTIYQGTEADELSYYPDGQLFGRPSKKKTKTCGI